MLMKLLLNYITLVKIVQHILFLVFLLEKKTEIVSKANTEESAVKLSEHVAEDSEESHPMFKYT